jgi:hypothetical protein
VVRGAASQTANLQEWQNSGGTVLSRVDNLGSISAPFFGSVNASRSYMQTDADTGSIQIFAGSASLKALTVRGAASQTANLQEWQNSAGTIQARVTSGGSIVTTQGFAVLGGASISGSIAALFQSATASRIPVVVQGAASQTANLQEWQNSAGSVLAFIRNDGVVRAPFLSTSNNWFFAGEQNSGGYLAMTKQTAAISNIGADRAGIYFRDGTVPGTLKLVVRAGTAGAETTILDNIPQ